MEGYFVSGSEISEWVQSKNLDGSRIRLTVIWTCFILILCLILSSTFLTTANSRRQYEQI
jgi:hypothetical protein